MFHHLGRIWVFLDKRKVSCSLISGNSQCLNLEVITNGDVSFNISAVYGFHFDDGFHAN